jgi:hypothetical protein
MTVGGDDMISRAASMSISLLLLTPGVGEPAELSGSLLYDDQLVSTVFSDVSAGIVHARSRSTSEVIYGTVDLATDSYSISGLEADGYFINYALERTPPADEEGNPGDLGTQETIEITDVHGSYQLDGNLRYSYSFISPADSSSVLNGSGWECHDYPRFSYPITVAIERVPLATEYTLNVTLAECPFSTVGFIETTSSEPSFDLIWGSAGEDYHSIWIDCRGASGKNLCSGSLLAYSDGSWRWLRLQNLDGTARGVHRTDTVVIPAVASAAGAQGTYWSSAVSVTDISGQARDIEVVYTPRGVDGLETYLIRTFTLPAGAQLSWTDIVGELFATSGAGSVEFGGRSLVVTSRTSTPAAGSGSYGQGIPPVQPEQLLSATGTEAAVMGGVEEGAAFRTNLGLCEIWGESASVRVVIFGGAMTELGARTYQLRPYENLQINQVASEIGGVATLVGGTVEVMVTAGDGKVAAYLSVVDNATGDPTYIAVAPQAPTGS